MIQLPNPKAMNAAYEIASMADDHLKYIKLSPDGFMYTTNGVAAIRSQSEPDVELFIKADKKPAISKSAVELHLDIEGSQIVEVRARSEARHDVEILKHVDFPSVENIQPSHLWVTGQQPLFDSIIAGNIAKAYGLKRGVWVVGTGDPARVYLSDVEYGDMIVLAAVNRE